MSSVSSKSDNNDRIRQLREEYEAREAKAQKKKDADMRRMRQAHAEELKDVAAGYDERLSEIRDKSIRNSTDNAVKHQEDIRSIQDVYRGQLKRKLEDSATEREILKQNAADEMVTANRISKSQQENSRANYDNSLAKIEKNFTDSIQRINQDSRESIESNAVKFREKNKKETDVLRKANEKGMDDNHRALRDLRNNYVGQLEDLRRTKDSKIQELERRNHDTQASNSETVASMNEGRSEELSRAQKDVRDKYSEGLQKYQEKTEGLRQEVREQLTDRVNNQVRSRDSKIRALQEKSIQDRVNSERQHEVEKKNISKFYSRQISDLTDQHAQELANQKEKSLDRSLKGLSQADRFLTDNQREAKLKMQLESFRAREDRENLKREQDRKVNYVTEHAESRVNRMEARARELAEQNEQFFEESKQQLQDNYATKLSELRETNLGEQMQIRDEANKRLDNIDKRNSQRNEAQKANYEYQMKQLKTDFERTVKNMQANLDERLRERDKIHNLEKENQETQFERQMTLIKDSHQEEIERMKNRQREELASVAQRYASYAAKKNGKA